MQQFQMISIYAYKILARKVYLAICSNSIDEGYRIEENWARASISYERALWDLLTCNFALNVNKLLCLLNVIDKLRVSMNVNEVVECDLFKHNDIC